MTIDYVIEHLRELADKAIRNNSDTNVAEEQLLIANWLIELKELREKHNEVLAEV